MIVVDDIASMPPKKRLFMWLHPKLRPTREPIVIINVMTLTAAMIGRSPIFTIFLKENSRPRVNMMKMTPMLDHVSILLVSDTVGTQVM